jgi:DNA processing protein
MKQDVLDDRSARVLLTRVGEPGDAALAHLVAALGAVEVVASLRAGTLALRELSHLQARLATADPAADLAAAAAVGGRFVVPGDSEWPTRVDDLVRLSRTDGGPSLGLWVRGHLNLATVCRRSVAVVGSRASTAYGEFVASELGYGLSERGWTVVSGGAFGIDAAAHRGALAGGGVTIAVLACGVDVAYPTAHSSLLERVAADGLVVSEWPPGCAPMRHRFLVRNRVIAALTGGTVVVEAAARSGALSTANRARDLSRHVMAVPGPVTSTMSEGCHVLLREPDVTCVRGTADVIELVGEMGADLAPEQLRFDDPRDDLDPIVRRVLEAVPVRRGVGAARIAVTAGVDPREVGRALGGLAARGLVERVDAGWRLSRDSAATHEHG